MARGIVVAARLGKRVLFSTVVVLLGLCVVVVPVAQASPANVSVSLSAAPPAPAAAGMPITYTLALGNSGTTASGVVTITDFLPWYVAGSATCGAVPGCSVQEHEVATPCPVQAETTNIVTCTGAVAITWTITSVAANATGLDLSAQVTSLGSASSNMASWLGDGCSTAGQIVPNYGVSGGCSTNTVSYPGAYVHVSESSNEASNSPGLTPGPAVTPGQRVDYTIAVDNSDGTAASGAVTITDSVPNSANSTLVPGSAACGSVPGCMVSVAPTATCSTGPCAGSLVTWVISSIASGAKDLTLSFSVTVNPSSTGSVVNQVLWNGPVNPPVAIAGTSVFTSGDGCVYATPPTATGCLVASLSNPIQAPIPQVTTPHTGEPWAGSGPLEVAVAGMGLGLVAAGYIQRRRTLQRRAG
ncbi:MAG TPA: hypothetical protein VEI83_04050 [Acidimicrobiales bacterium]|nr:hypothetical protein [Acidimicrobiales bacterium]